MLVALGFALGTRCACGIRLCTQDLLHSWPWALPLRLAALVKLFLFTQAGRGCARKQENTGLGGKRGGEVLLGSQNNFLTAYVLSP